jgi:plastocyanin
LLLALLALICALGVVVWQFRKQVPQSTPVLSGAPVKQAEAPHIPRDNAADPATGDIEGEVALDGPAPPMPPLKVGTDPICSKAQGPNPQVLLRNGKLENVVVRIAGGPKQTPPSAPIEVLQHGCRYLPRVQGAVAGQTLIIRNRDPTLHNVHSYEAGKTLFNQAQPAQGAPIEKTVGTAASVLTLKCDVHPWMTAFIAVNDNRWFAVTGGDGQFRISGIPEGNYHLAAWHERFGTKTAEVAVKAGETARVAFSYRPDDRGQGSL